jgi:YegS/Rv2252/BmrU family lipid kinase
MSTVDTSAPRTIAIVNEHAGGGAMADIFRRLEHPLQDAIGPFDVAFTDGPGHAIALVRRALSEGYRRVLSGGGDGTLNECVNGFFSEDGRPLAPDATLALLSGGTGGDFRKTLGLRSSEDALKALAQGKTVLADVGRVTFATQGGTDSRCFINIASFGMSGVVDRLVRSYARYGGKIAYYGATLRGMWGWKNPVVALTLDGEELAPLPIFTVAVGNGRYFGGGMQVCPDARLDSGMFEVCVLGDFSRLELLLQSQMLYSGTHVYNAKVQMRRAKVVDAAAVGDREVLLDIDGEPLGSLPARFEILPATIRLVVP